MGVADYFATFVCLFSVSLGGTQKMLDGSEKIITIKKIYCCCYCMFVHFSSYLLPRVDLERTSVCFGIWENTCSLQMLLFLETSK